MSKKPKALPRHVSALLIILNAVLVAGAALFYTRYTSAYTDRLRAENIGNITNLNESAVMNATALFESWNTKLNDLTIYAEKHGMTSDEALDFISDANSRDDRYFQLLKKNTDESGKTTYRGYLAAKDGNGDFIALDYSDSSYAPLKVIFDKASAERPDRLCFTPEFTDAGPTGVKFFAIYRYITLKNNDGSSSAWTIMLAMKAKYVLEVLNVMDDYDGQSTVLIDASGNFIVNNQYFMSANLFQYIRERNNLSIAESYSLRQKFQSSEHGVLYYKKMSTNGSILDDYVFCYQLMSEVDDARWFCVTCVPLSSFRTPEFNVNYLIYAIVFILALFLMDMLWMQVMNRRLRTSILREKQANAAKGNFLSRMSHEIRTPLNAIIGYNAIAKGAVASVQDDAERKQAEMKVVDCLTKSEIASKHLLTVINDVLDMSAIDSGKIQVEQIKFDFKGLISSLTTVFYSQAKTKGVNFEVIFDSPTDEWFLGDQMRTNQILTNLLSNAVKFTADGGSVTLRIKQTDGSKNSADIHIDVCDTGIGMSQDYLNHIWIPFEQADSSISRRFGGSGLGLSITKSLVDLMGGTIDVKSTLGVGTTFSVDLSFGKTDQPVSAGYDFSKVNALTIDDDASTCDYIKMLFNRCGAKCDSVNSGAAAVKAFSSAIERGENYTVCLVDWRMPGMDGIETIRRIRDIAGSNLPIIILTAYDFSEITERASEVGVSKFISKPLFQSSLFDVLVNINGIHYVKPETKPNAVEFDGARILLAEDNTMNMEIAKTILTSAGLSVDSAWNGKEAVEMFEASQPGTYAMILMDVHMPEINGHDATRTIRASSHPEAKTIPIIAMTADAFAENVTEAHDAGMNGHISKPIDIQVLFDTLKKYIKPNRNS